nr:MULTISPECIES: transposase [unclassified Arthrobacter]
MKLGSAMVDEVRRRVQQDTLGHRGRKGGSLYGIRRTLQIGVEHLTDKHAARLAAKVIAGNPDDGVTLAWRCYQNLRDIYHARPEPGTRERCHRVIPLLPDPEVARLGRTLKQWTTGVLAYFETNGASHGPTEVIDGVIETTHRIA